MPTLPELQSMILTEAASGQTGGMTALQLRNILLALLMASYNSLNYTPSDTAPQGPSEGDLWFNPSTDTLSIWTGSVWQNLAARQTAVLQRLAVLEANAPMRVFPPAQVGGTAGAIALTSPAGFARSSYTGLVAVFRAEADAPVGATVNVDELGAAALRQQTGDALTAGMISSGDLVMAVHDPADGAFDCVGVFPVGTSSGDMSSFVQRVLVNVAASAGSVDKWILEDGQAYTTVERIISQGTPKDAAFESVRFDLGYFGDESALDPTFYAVGRYYYNFARHTPRVNRYVSGNSGPKHWVDGDAATLVTNITADVGYFPSDDAAKPHINGVGNVYYNDRLRVYRRARSFTAGTGPVTGEERLRSATEDDLARIEAERHQTSVNRLEIILETSPAHIDVNDFTAAFEITVVVETNRWTANGLRIILLGHNQVYPFDPAQKTHRISVPVTDQMRANARLVTEGASPTYKTRVYAGVQQDNVELASTAIDLVVTDGTIGVVEGLTADLRRVTPPSWVTATGTGVGLAISRTIVTDLSTLTFTPAAMVPSAASAGDEVYYYVSVPTAGLDLDDWRISLGGVAIQHLSDFGDPAGTVGANNVYSQAYSVGDGSAGLGAATAPGATITLQFHDQHHTAYSGVLEGPALQQVQQLVAEGGGAGQPAAQKVVEAQRASSATAGKIAIKSSGEGLFTTVSKTHPTTTPSWDNAEYTHANFIGVRDSSPPFTGHDIGDWFASPFTLKPRILVQRSGYRDWDTTTWEAVGITTFRGGAVNSAAMADRIEADGDLWIDTDDEMLFEVSNFVAGTAGATTYEEVDYATVEDVHRVEEEIAGKHDALSLAGQIGLVRFQSVIPTFEYRYTRDFIRTWEVSVDGPELVTGDLWYDRWVNAAVVPGGRVKWTSTTNSINFPSTEAAQGTLLGTQTYPLSLWFYDAESGGNLVEIVNIRQGITLIDAPFAINSAANILYDVDTGSRGIVSAGVLTLAHDATLNITGGRDGSEATVQITQAVRPQGGWLLTLHSSIRRFNGIAAPVLKTANGAVDILRFRRIGATWYFIGFVVQDGSGASAGPGTPPRKITAKSAGVYELTAAETIIHVEVTNGTDRPYGRDIMRADLTGTAKEFFIDSRDPQGSQSDNKNGLLGVNASISGNDLTINVTGFVTTSALSSVWGIVSGAPGDGGSGGLAAPTIRAMTGTDRFVYVEQGATGVLKYAAASLTQMIDRFRSGMAVATSSAKGLMSAAMFNKLNALRTNDQITAAINAIGDLRTRFATSATPVAQDRFFFTDENQSGDPIRYATFNNLQAAIVTLDPADLAKRTDGYGLSDARRQAFAALAGSDVWLDDVRGAPVAPTADNQHRILWRWWEEEWYVNRPTHRTAPTLAKRDLANTDLPPGYNWGGVHVTSPGGVQNNIWFDRDPNARGWRRRITSPFSTDVFWTPNFGYLGYFDTEAQAAAAANAYEVAHGDSSANGLVYVVGNAASVITNLNASVPDDYGWFPGLGTEKIVSLLQGAITPDLLDADTEVKKAALRLADGSASVSLVTTTLPAGNATNNGDWIIVGSDISSGITWQDFGGGALTSAEAGDLGVYVGGRTWQRVGNMIKGPAKLRTQTLTSAAAVTWNMNQGHTALLTLGHNVTLTISGGEDGDLAYLKAKQDATGSRTLTLHAGILRYKGAAAPALTTTARASDMLLFINDGGTWYYVEKK